MKESITYTACMVKSFILDTLKEWFEGDNPFGKIHYNRDRIGGVEVICNCTDDIVNVTVRNKYCSIKCGDVDYGIFRTIDEDEEGVYDLFFRHLFTRIDTAIPCLVRVEQDFGYGQNIFGWED